MCNAVVACLVRDVAGRARSLGVDVETIAYLDDVSFLLEAAELVTEVLGRVADFEEVTGMLGNADKTKLLFAPAQGAEAGRRAEVAAVRASPLASNGDSSPSNLTSQST